MAGDCSVLLLLRVSLLGLPPPPLTIPLFHGLLTLFCYLKLILA
jgi:hypothetical protein